MTPEQLAAFAADTSMSATFHLDLSIDNDGLTPEKRAAIHNMILRQAKGLQVQLDLLCAGLADVELRRRSSRLGTTTLISDVREEYDG